MMVQWRHTEEVFLHRNLPDLPGDGNLDPSNLDSVTAPGTDTWEIVSVGKNIWAYWDNGSSVEWRCVRVAGTADTASAVEITDGDVKYLYVRCLKGGGADTLDDHEAPTFVEVDETTGDTNGLVYTAGAYAYFRVAKAVWEPGDDAPSIQLYHRHDLVLVPNAPLPPGWPSIRYETPGGGGGPELRIRWRPFAVRDEIVSADTEDVTGPYLVVAEGTTGVLYVECATDLGAEPVEDADINTPVLKATTGAVPMQTGTAVFIPTHHFVSEADPDNPGAYINNCYPLYFGSLWPYPVEYINGAKRWVW